MSSLTTASDRIDRLAQDLRHHKRLHYAGEPTISDAQYDALEDELRALIAAHPQLTPADNPLEQVGADLAGELYADARHEVAMLSLEKATSDAELDSFLGRFAGQTSRCGRSSTACRCRCCIAPAGWLARRRAATARSAKT